MEALYAPPRVDLYATRTRPDRYRLELTAQMEGDFDEADAALRRMGYEPVDVDQWGTTYRHREDRQREVMLDELPSDPASLRLALSREDVEATHTDRARDEMQTTYQEIRRWLQWHEPGPGQNDFDLYGWHEAYSEP